MARLYELIKPQILEYKATNFGHYLKYKTHVLLYCVLLGGYLWKLTRWLLLKRTKLGANKQKALKFHEILAKLLFIKAYRRFSTSQILADFKDRFLRAYNPMESTIFSSEKSYSPCKLKWLHRMTESFRMASISSFLRSSLLSLPSSFAR